MSYNKIIKNIFDMWIERNQFSIEAMLECLHRQKIHKVELSFEHILFVTYVKVTNKYRTCPKAFTIPEVRICND